MPDSVPKTPNPNEGASRLPAKIGRYDVVEKLGSGSTGTVYRASDPFIGRVLAIKTFRVDLPAGPQRDRFLQRFYHEARISGGLSHPNIVALFDVGEMDGLPYLVFEHVEGPTLDVALARAGRLDSAETIRVVEQAASALDFAHAKGIVHRDIRPANIILANDKRIRIADFGIARVEGSHLTQHGEVLGTPAYMSPEQIRGQELSPSSDLFALAVCAYEMLSGQRPFGGKTQPELLEALVYSPPAEPRELRTLGIPSRDFMFVFERALAKDPSHRFADAASFARALKSCLGVAVPNDEPLPVSRIAVPEAPPPFRRAILPPVAPPPPAPYRMDTSATVSLDASKAASSADATMISNYAGEGGSGNISDDPTLIAPTVGFDQGLNAKKLAMSADATMVSPGNEAESPPTQQRMSRQTVESLLSKSAPSQGPPPTTPLQKTHPGSEKLPSTSASAIEDLLPPTRDMPKLPEASRTASQPPLSKGNSDKTIIMTEGEKAAAAQLRDRSASRIPTGQSGSAKPAAPPPPPRASLTRPPTQATLPPPVMAAPRSSLVPKILLAAMVLLTVLALALAVLFWGKAGKPAPEAGERWNNLPVYQEADVEKSPLLFSHEVPKPKLEPGRVVSVTVSWIVTPEGVVDDPKIIASASPEIDAFVLEGIRKWRYEPGQKDGKTVPVRVLRKYTFGQEIQKDRKLAKLIINPQMPSRKEIDLPRADLSIGRDPNNDVVIPDALVSRRHARIVFDGREYLFHDCESSNGSLLNGDRVSERKLSDGDVLWLGASRLLFRAPEAPVEGNLAKVIQHPSSQRMKCPACEEPFQAGDVFCRQCGTTLEARLAVSLCASCNARVVGPARFCNACGDSLAPRAGRSLAYQRRLDRAERADTSAIEGVPQTATAEKRLLASLVDFLATAAIFALFSLPPLGIYLNFENGAAIASWLMALPLLSFPAYFIGFWVTRGATPGKELLGLSVVMKDGKKSFGLGPALVRFSGLCVSLATLGLGFMLILIDGDTLHDRLARTRVVERRL